MAGLALAFACAAGVAVAEDDLCPPYEPVNAPTQPMLSFTQEAAQRGLIYAVQPWNGPTQQFWGFGTAIVDLNNNGLNDIIVMGRADGRVGFFENNPANPGYFIDRSFVTIFDIPTPKLVLPKASGVAVGDYNGDGFLNIYITQEHYQENVLLTNDGNFNFLNIADAAGVANPGYGECASFGDFDNDGWIDLYVVNYTHIQDIPFPDRRNKLYRNLGDGTFEDVSFLYAVDDPGAGFTAVWSDINRDCWLDLYLVNDRGHLGPEFKNQLWRNDSGLLSNISQQSGAGMGLWSMGIAAGDLTGNGYPDFYVTNLPWAMPSAHCGLNPLLINQGDEKFVEKCEHAGVCQYIFSWAAIFFDATNNGWLDLYVVNETKPNNFFANYGRFPLANAIAEANLAGSTNRSFNASVGDVTGNGALDVLLNNYGPHNGPAVNVQLFINHEGATRNWIRYRVVGTWPNTAAIGANIDTRTGEKWQFREIYAGGNNMKAQNELIVHVGMGNALVADEIVVTWPGCEYQRTLTNYPANNVWTLYPPYMLGDVDGNGVIDIFDLLGVLAAWGTIKPGNELMDLNGDGVIDIFDLLGVLAMWGQVN